MRLVVGGAGIAVTAAVVGSAESLSGDRFSESAARYVMLCLR